MENFIFCVVATHAPIVVTSSHDFNIDFEKTCDRREKVIKILQLSQDNLKTRDFRKKRENRNCPFKTGVSLSKWENCSVWNSD